MKKNPGSNLANYVSNVYYKVDIDEDVEIVIDSTNELFNSKEWTGYDYTSPNEYDELSYLKGRSLSPQEWRWEFTRRNELYRRIYLLRNLPIKPKTQRSPARLAEDIFGTTRHTNPNRGVLHMRSAAIGWEEGKSKSLFCPDFEGSVLFKENRRINRIIYSNDPRSDIRFEHPYVFYASFDPSRDAKEQIEFVKSYLAEQQRNFKKIRKTRRQFELWPTYLRILDAIDGGQGPTKAAELIGSDPDAVKASIKQAKRWVRECLLIL